MEKSTLTVTECIKFGWKTFVARPWFFVGTAVIFVILQLLVGALQEELPGLLTFLISLVVSTLMYTGILSVYLKAHDNVQTPTYKDLWNPAPFFSYLALSILLLIIVGIGFVLLVIPGIYLALAFSFSNFLVIERGMNPIEALKESFRLTKGHKWKLFLLSLALLGLAVIGIIPLMLGLFIVAPVAMLASTHAYRTLSGGTLAKVVETPESTPADIA